MKNKQLVYRDTMDYPPRIKNLSNCKKFYRSGMRDFSLVILPFKEVNGKIVKNPEWSKAPYEIRYVAFLEKGENPPPGFVKTRMGKSI